MDFVDIHNHSLYGIDDGPKSQAEMQRMLDDAYAGGTRVICFTPHLHPGMFPTDDSSREAAFLAAKEYANSKYPEMELFLAGELRYSRNCMNWFCESRFGCMGLKSVLVDFSADETEKRILQGIHDLLRHGYLPILAHAERYKNLPLAQIEALRRNDVLIQTDTKSFFGGFGFKTKLRAKHMLKKDLIDIISSDAHDCSRRPADMRECYQYIKEKKGAAYAQALCASNARRLLYSE